MNITMTSEVKLTPEDLAEEIWKLNSGEQAELLEYLSKIDAPFVIFSQLQYITENKKLTQNGRWLMETIGQYSNYEFK